MEIGEVIVGWNDTNPKGISVVTVAALVKIKPKEGCILADGRLYKYTTTLRNFNFTQMVPHMCAGKNRIWKR